MPCSRGIPSPKFGVLSREGNPSSYQWGSCFFEFPPWTSGSSRGCKAWWSWFVAWVHQLCQLTPLLFLDESNGPENIFEDPIILLLMILIQPQTINHHEDPLEPSPSDSIYQWQGFKSFARKDTFSIFIHHIKISTLSTISLGFTTSFTLLITVFEADPLLGHHVIHAHLDFRRLFNFFQGAFPINKLLSIFTSLAETIDKSIPISTFWAVVGE